MAFVLSLKAKYHYHKQQWVGCCVIISSLLRFAAMRLKAILSSISLVVVVLAVQCVPLTYATLATEEQALIVSIKLPSGGMGSTEERGRIIALEHELSDAIKNSEVGDLDGDEYGGGVCTIYIYGPSAKRLSAVALPILTKFRAPSGSYVIKRYGKPGAKEDRIALNG